MRLGVFVYLFKKCCNEVVRVLGHIMQFQIVLK